jgi:hypothetical protein
MKDLDLEELPPRETVKPPAREPAESQQGPAISRLSTWVARRIYTPVAKHLT